MPPPGYQPRVRVQVPGAAPARAADTSIAEGIGALGNALGDVVDNRRAVEEARRASQYRIDQEQQRRDRSALIADRAGAFATVQLDIGTALDEARNQVGAGAPGWREAATKIVDDRMSAFVETLGDDPEVAQRFTPLVANYGAQTIGREQDWGRAKKAQHEKAGLESFADASILQAEEDGNLQGAFDKFDIVLDGMDLDATDSEAVRLAYRQKVVDRVVGAQIAGGRTKEARAAMELPALKSYLTPENRERLFGEADRADERAAVAAEREAAEQVRAARETVKTVQALMDGGAVPTPAQMDALRAAQTLLPPSEQVEVAAIDTQVAVNRATTGVPAAGIRAERDRLQAKDNAGQASQTEQMMLAAYNKRLDAAEGEEADELKNLMGEGTAGRIAGVERLQGMDAASRAAIADRAAPGMGAVAVLPAQLYRRMAIEGAVIRREQKDLVPEKEAVAAFRQNVGSVGAMLGEQYDDKMAVAMDLYAHDVSRRPQKGFNARLFWQYTNIAFGATKREDGSFQGGLGTVNGVRTVLPDNLSQAEMLSTIARTDWSAARDRAGKPVAKAFITSQMAPVLVDESPTTSVYHMRDRAGQPLLGPNGVPLEFKVPNRVRR